MLWKNNEDEGIYARAKTNLNHLKFVSDNLFHPLSAPLWGGAPAIDHLIYLKIYIITCQKYIYQLFIIMIYNIYHRSQCFLTWSRIIKLFEPSEGIFRDPTKYWTTKKICKIGPLGPKEKIDFFSFFLMRKRLSSGQKWFLRPYFPLIRGMFLLKSGLWFSFRALPVPEPRLNKRS